MKSCEFALQKGYPFLPPVSIENYPVDQRIQDSMFIENQVIQMNKPMVEKKLGLESGVDDSTFDKAFYLGIVDRVLVSEHALAESENQIIDMMKDMPFIPEDFQFDKAISPGSINDSPVTIYKSKLMSGVLLTREPDQNNHWIIMKDGSKTKYLITSARVAVCIFYALEIPISSPPE